MSVKKMTKEELELMSYNDITNLLLEEKKEQTTADLFKQICDLLELPKSVFENKIGSFYTSLTTDKRFILLENGNWDLKKNHSVKVLKIEEVLEDMEDINTEELLDDDDDFEEDNEEKDIVYDENPDDDLDDITEDYKNLVIVDEEDLENIEP